MGRDTTFPGVGGTQQGTPLGASISADHRPQWLPPWHVTVRWQGDSELWAATVKAGFVNGEAPIVRTTVPEQASLSYETNSLSGKELFSDFAFGREEPGAPQVVDLPLYLWPALPLPWRPLGYDGDPSAFVPAFFQEKGVALSPLKGLGSDANKGALASLDLSLLATQITKEPPKTLRLLRACDIWLRQPRPALTSQISLEPGLATGVSNVTQTLSVRPPNGDPLRLMSGELEIPTATDPLKGVYEEQAWDDLLVANVYVLSPLHTAPNSDPDSTWTPYVQHRLWWNLHYANTPFRPVGGDPGIPFIPPLAGGAGQIVINSITSSLNDATQRALNILSSHSLAGAFCTPTGGGSSIDFPEQPPAAPVGRTGLDKDGRLRARAQAAITAETYAERPDPDYPYGALPFTPDLLTPTT